MQLVQFLRLSSLASATPFLSGRGNGSNHFLGDTRSPIASTKNGTVVGFRNDQYDQDMFLGIPYAAPPIGDLRFRRPQPLNETWSERPATTFGKWCMQAPLELVGFSRPDFTPEESEDCLTINIVRPAGVDEYTRLPVLVWIYGGGQQEGGSADQRYNSSSLVEESVSMGQPIIHITFNYRVSGFGFLSGRDIFHSGSANVGFYDQRMALHWIQDNIAAFGGDPYHVTISGESAGGLSVGVHYLAYSGRDDGLFHAGICQSSGPLDSAAYANLDQQNEAYDRVLKLSGCGQEDDGMACLRAVPAKSLREIFQGVSYGGVIDGNIITNDSVHNVRGGNFVQRPLLIGSNLNEGTAFTLEGRTRVDTAAEFAEIVSGMDAAGVLTNETTDMIVGEYLNLSESEVATGLGTVRPSPNATLGSLYGRVSLFMGDYMFLARQRLVSQIWAQAKVPIYGYRFDVPMEGFDHEVLGATHFAEIGFTFKNKLGLGWPVHPLRPADESTFDDHLRLATTMSRMWVRFASTYNPNSNRETSDVAPWPVYMNQDPRIFVFALNGHYVEPDTRRLQAMQSILDNALD